MIFSNKTVLITGGTGSFGKSFLDFLIKKTKVKKIIIFSRDELKQFQIRQQYIKEKNFKKLRFFLGDIRDLERLKLAFRNVDIVIHAAALKQVDTAEYNPIEFIKTNIIGSENVIVASDYNNVKKVIALSTDKASSPINLYGATKLCSDKLFISANFYLAKKIFSVVRYGNVEGSRGSIIPSLLKNQHAKKMNVTHKEMTRFSISLKDSVSLVIWALKNTIGGEILVPKIPSYRVIDLVKTINPNCKINYSGIRPGEKIHEEMISINDSLNTLEIKDKYIILPNFNEAHYKFNVKKLYNYYKSNFNAKTISKNFSYNSGTNENFLSKIEIKKIIKNVSKSSL